MSLCRKRLLCKYIYFSLNTQCLEAMPSSGGIAGKIVFCLCGPIGSLCCFVFSIWGVIMLVHEQYMQTVHTPSCCLCFSLILSHHSFCVWYSILQHSFQVPCIPHCDKYVSLQFYSVCVHLNFTPIQFLLGGFYHIKAVVLFEDLLQTQFVGIKGTHDSDYWNNMSIPLIFEEYFDPKDVDDAYQQAAQ